MPDPTTVADLCDWLDDRFPAALSEDWDNTGLLVGDRSAGVRRVLTCLTLTEDVAEEAAGAGVSLVVSHHPLMFRGVKRLTADAAEGRTLLRLISAGVAVYAPHTRFDSAAEGINQRLAESLGLEDVKPLRPAEDAATGGGRFGSLPRPTPAADFAAAVAEACDVGGLHLVAAPEQTVSRVAVACGAAGEYLADAAAAGCDGFLLGEARFHTALEARDRGLALFVPGHYATERPSVERLAGDIAAAFPGLDCSPSRVEADPLRWHAVR